MFIQRVISGGQAGVDRGALDAAMERGVATGWRCPPDRLDEVGTIPKKYSLIEMPDGWSVGEDDCECAMKSLNAW